MSGFEMESPYGAHDNLFGLIGDTKDSQKNETLGGLVISTTKGADAPKVTKSTSADAMKSEFKLPTAKAPKTVIPGTHYGQVPYPGKYMSEKGQRL